MVLCVLVQRKEGLFPNSSDGQRVWGNKKARSHLPAQEVAACPHIEVKKAQHHPDRWSGYANVLLLLSL